MAMSLLTTGNSPRPRSTPTSRHPIPLGILVNAWDHRIAWVKLYANTLVALRALHHAKTFLCSFGVAVMVCRLTRDQ